MSTENKTNTNTNTTTNTTISSNAAEVIEKVQGLNESNQQNIRASLTQVDEMVDSKLASFKAELKELNDSKISSEVVIKLEKAVAEKTQDLQGKILGLKTNLDAKDDEVVRLNSEVKVLEAEIETLVALGQAAKEDSALFKAELTKLLGELSTASQSNLKLEKQIIAKEAEITTLQHQVEDVKNKASNEAKKHAQAITIFKEEHESEIGHLKDKIESIESQHETYIKVLTDKYEAEEEQAIRTTLEKSALVVIEKDNVIKGKDVKIQELEKQLEFYRQLAKTRKTNRLVAGIKFIFNK